MPAGRRRLVKNLKPIDRVLLAVLLPLWVVCFSLSVRSAVRDAFFPFFLSADAATPSEYPRVIAVARLGTGGASTLAVGDTLLRVGGADLRGASTVDVRYHLGRQTGSGGHVMALAERGGRQVELILPGVSFRLLFPLLLISLSCAVTAFLLALRAPRQSEAVRPAIHLFLFGALAFGSRFAGDMLALRFSLFVDVVSNAIVCPLLLRSLLFFPRGVAPENGWLRGGIWATLVYGPLYMSAVYGIPWGLSEGLPVLFFGANAVLYALAPVAFTYSYRRSDRIGRRQMRWVVFGAYCAAAPGILGALLVLYDERFFLLWLTSLGAMAVFPVALLIAIARYNLFDIDQLISAATSYTIALGALLAAGLILVPRGAEFAARMFGFEPAVAQVLLAFMLAGLVVPARRWLSPAVDRRLFPERYALALGVDRLLGELSGCAEPAELPLRTGEELERLIRPESCVIYTRGGARFSPIFVRGVSVPADVDPAGPFIEALQREGKPLDVQEWLRARGVTRLSEAERGLIASLRAAVLVPVPGRQDLAGFIALGAKHSGDVYTPTDLALLGVVANKVATELLRFDDATLAAIGERMAGMMHDLKNPLTIALGYTEMLSSAETAEERAEFTQTIQKQFDLVQRMARDVLAYARGESPLLIGKVRLDAFLRDLRSQLEPELEKHSVHLEIEAGFEDVAWFDEAKLLRAIYNLARNAVEAMPEGGTFRVATRREDARLVLELSDTGKGIPPEITEQLFTPFATAGKEGGTGLGLATVKKIVDEHGGTISVRSSSDTGACFRIELPLERQVERMTSG